MLRISVFMYLLFSTFSITGFFLTPYLQSLKLNASQIGTILAAGSLIAIFAQPTWGYISDKRKTVKPVLQVLLMAGFMASIGFFSSSSFAMILLFFAIFSFFNSSAGPLAETLCIAYAAQHNKEFGRIRLWGEVGVGISSLLLGILVERVGIHHLGFIYAVAISIAILATLLLQNTGSASAPVHFASLGRLLVKPELLRFLLLVLLLGIPHRMNDSMLAIYLGGLGATDTQLGLAWLVATLSSVPALLFVGRLMRKWNELGIFIVAALAYSARWAIYSLADSPILLIMAQLFQSLTFPLFLVASIQYLFSIVPHELRATGQAAFSVTFGGLGGIIGSSVGGMSMEHAGPHLTYAGGSLLAWIGAMAAIAVYVMERKKGRPALAAPSGKQADT